VHELLRLLERAFARSSSQLTAPLSQFLASAPLGYTAGEVTSWISDVRHPLTHTDRRDIFALDTDVAPFVPRLEQAAFDVLCNKEHWRDPGSGRRSLWHPTAWVSRQGQLVRSAGTGGQFVQLLDPFGAYPVHLEGNLFPLPSGVWFRFVAAE